MWFVKSKRAQTSDDDETWVAGGVVPTLNAFDCGDTRATVLIFEATRVEDVRIYEEYCPTVARYWGTGGARVPYVYALQATMIGREDHNGPNGSGFKEDEMFTLTKTDVHAIAFQLAGDRDNPSVSVSETAFCLPANPMSDRGQNVMAFDSYNQSVSETSQTIRKGQAGNDHVGMVMETSVVRRLTPTECERLQGFPDGWTEGQADSHRYKQMGNAVAVPVVQWIIDRLVK